MVTSIFIPFHEEEPLSNSIYLLMNLGTPEAPRPERVAPFLKEFLNDPLVIDIPTLFRWPLVNFFIVPRRLGKVVDAYRSIWTKKGSPLKVHTEQLAAALQRQVGHRAEVKWVMRYGKPTLESILSEIDPEREIKVLPLYPQYALSSTQSSLNEIKRQVKKFKLKNRIKFLPHFYQYNEFNSIYASIFKKYAPDQWDHVLFSFHGLPVRHLTKVTPKGSHCTRSPNCCDEINLSNSHCYRAQSYHSAHQIAHHIGLPKDKYTVSFQSRLGRAEWIKPYTDIWLEEAIHQGIKDLVVLCPSFVTDCLETLEEIKIRECENFKKRGGRSLNLIPCLNSEPEWICALEDLFIHHDKDWLALNEN